MEINDGLNRVNKIISNDKDNQDLCELLNERIEILENKNFNVRLDLEVKIDELQLHISKLKEINDCLKKDRKYLNYMCNQKIRTLKYQKLMSQFESIKKIDSLNMEIFELKKVNNSLMNESRSFYDMYYEKIEDLKIENFVTIMESENKTDVLYKKVCELNETKQHLTQFINNLISIVRILINKKINQSEFRNQNIENLRCKCKEEKDNFGENLLSELYNSLLRYSNEENDVQIVYNRNKPMIQIIFHTNRDQYEMKHVADVQKVNDNPGNGPSRIMNKCVKFSSKFMNWCLCAVSIEILAYSGWI